MPHVSLRTTLWIVTCCLVVTLLMVGAAILSYFVPLAPTAETDRYSYTNEDLIALTKPSVQRLVYKADATFTIQPFRINRDTLLIEKRTGPAAQPITREPDNLTRTATGFFIHPDGYFLTNAHATTKEMVKMSVAQEVLMNYAEQLAAGMSHAERQRFIERLETMSPEKQQINFRRLMDFVSADYRDEQIRIARPDANRGSVQDIVRNGFAASRVEENTEFLIDGRDLSLLKVEEGSVPALAVNEPSDAAVGDDVHTFGFPATARVTQMLSTEPTFTSGTINAFKALPGSSGLEVLQVDMKSSEGASGSPILNSVGEAIGILSFMSGENEIVGDSFVFGVPAGQISSFLAGAPISPQTGEYNRLMREAMVLKQGNHCQAAIERFRDAQAAVNDAFPVAKHGEQYINECQTMIQRGESVDTYWDWFMQKVADGAVLLWVLAVFAIGVVITVAVILYELFQKLEREEAEIEDLQEFTHYDERNESGETPQKPGT